MLEEIKTPLCMNAADITLQEYTLRAINDFEYRITNIYNFANKLYFENQDIPEEDIKLAENIKSTLYSTDMYKVFYSFGDLIKKAGLFDINKYKINNKNINFIQSITNTRDLIKAMVLPCEIQSQDDGKLHQVKQIKEIPAWEGLFGGGEFPFMRIYVFRLGNTEYFAYDITR